ncbi:MAG TPA: sugar phosphate isomerase/epimerase family protein [Verrucomicrobiota bacterium]|nr:xylose isomerase [Verrucomicrobiales bacterium]HRI14851.1 sugar phosphate isomerase/epimerase family protein [Verrucomicrobiota bacterium]
MNRRSFLHLSASTAAALAVTRLGADTTQKRPLKKGIMWGTVGVKGSTLEKMQAIKAAGYDGVEMMGGGDQEEIANALAATGLVCGSVCCHTHWAKPLSDPNPEVRKVGVEGLKQSLRDAKRYGAPSVLLVPAVVNATVSYDDAWTRSVAEIKKVIPLAEELGVKISIENVWNNFLLSPLEAARYVDEFQSPAVKWHFDVGNVVVYGWPEQWVRVLGPRLQTLHIKEFSRTKADKQGRWAGFDVEFLKGDNNWPAVMKALDDTKFSGWAIAEQPGADSPEGLQKLSREMDEIFAK